MKNFIILLALSGILLLGYLFYSDKHNFLNVKEDGSNKSVDFGIVNVYSSRKEALIEDLFAAFTKETNIKVNYITDDSSNLIARMKSEGEKTSADVFLTADVINLIMAQKYDLLQEVNSSVLSAAIPENLRNGFWYGFTKRGRVIVYSKERVDPIELSTYEDLASPKWKGRLLMRSSNSYYNQSLLSSIIASEGEPQARIWVRGIVRNMARSPKGGDIDQIKAITAGEGDVTIVNTYYVGRFMASEDKNIVAKVAVFFPNQENRGMMVNISGGAVTKFAKNRDNAVKFLEFMVSPIAQKMYTEQNYEYPVLESVVMSPLLASWGPFKADELQLKNLGQYLNLATKIADEEGWK